LSVILSEVICVPKDNLEGSVLSESSDSEVEPVFGAGVQTDIGVPFDLDGERRRGDDMSTCDISSWEAAIDEYSIVEW